MKKNRFKTLAFQEMFVGRVCTRLLNLASCPLSSVRIQFNALASTGLSNYFGQETKFSALNPHHVSCLFAYLDGGPYLKDDTAFTDWNVWCCDILSL